MFTRTHLFSIELLGALLICGEEVLSRLHLQILFTWRGSGREWACSLLLFLRHLLLSLHVLFLELGQESADTANQTVQAG